nr:MAG TPA: hypothetical protein [Caudoviricetes sp.]
MSTHFLHNVRLFLVFYQNLLQTCDICVIIMLNI